MTNLHWTSLLGRVPGSQEVYMQATTLGIPIHDFSINEECWVLTPKEKTVQHLVLLKAARTEISWSVRAWRAKHPVAARQDL